MIGATRQTLAAEIARQAKLSGDISKLQAQVSSGKRLVAASDDPAAAARVAAIRRTLADHKVWSGNADAGLVIAGAADAVLSTAGSSLDRAKELLLAGRSDTSSPTDRAAYAAELRTIAHDVAGDMVATDPNGRRLFPDAAPTPLAISDTQSVAATLSKSAAFDVAAGTTSRPIVDVLNAAADAVELGDGATMSITDAEGTAHMLGRGDATSTAIGTLDAAIDHVTTARADQGIREQRFSDAKERLAAADTELAVARSGLEDTDLTYALSEVQAKQLSLQAAQTMMAQSRKSSLFDMLG